jgi:ketosteroid isomerase-like protein
MNNDNVAAVRNAYAVAERKDLEGWINLFTSDGVFVDNSVGTTYRGRALATQSAIMARRFPTCTASYIASMSTAMWSWCS